MTSNQDFRVGDIISITYQIKRVYSDGSFDTEYSFINPKHRDVTLIERPSPKVSVEISVDEIEQICRKLAVTGDCGPGSAWDIADNIRTEAYKVIDGQ